MDDVDKTMTTSTSSTPSNLQDNLIPDEGFEEGALSPEDNDGPRTPANDHLNAAAPGELSPPRSQPSIDYTTAPPPQSSRPSETMANGTATRSSARSSNNQSKFGGGSGGGADTTAFPNLAAAEREGANQPGWGWKNKKAQEEMQRAWDNIVDRDFSIKEYGDVMMQGKAQMSGQ